MIKAIITDLDGVIRYYPQERDQIYEEKLKLSKGDLLDITFNNPYLSNVLNGVISDDIWRKNIMKRLEKITAIKNSHQLYKEWSSFPGLINYKILNLFLKWRKKGIFLVLLSNATDKLKKDLECLSILENFDLIINSSTYGVSKPEKEIFELTLTKLDALPSEVIFIDDSLKNINAAKKFGIVSHHFHDFLSLELFLANVLNNF